MMEEEKRSHADYISTNPKRIKAMQATNRPKNNSRQLYK